MPFATPLTKSKEKKLRNVILIAQLVTNIFSKFWSSGVRALPVAAGTNEGGHYF